MAQIQPNPSIIYEALTLWFRDCSHGEIEIGWRDPAAGKLNKFRRFQLDEIEELATFVDDVNRQEGANIYFRPATVQPTNGPATDADVVQLPGVWADCDDSAAVGRLTSKPLEYRPTFLIVTGRNPELRAQAFWQFREPVMQAADVRQINSYLSTHFGADPMVVNPSRLMRVPGSVSWPVKKGRTVVEQTEWMLPADASGRHYPLEAWHSLMREHPVKAPEITTSSPEIISGDAAEVSQQEETGGFVVDTGHKGVSIADLYRDVRVPGHWHHATLRLVASWVNRGFSDLEIKMMAPTLTTTGYTVQQTVRELEAMIEGARNKWGIKNPDPLADTATAKAVALGEDTADEFDDLPMRPWIVKDYLMEGCVSILSGQGAGGKSSVVVLMTTALASGLPCGGFVPIEPCHVINYNVEDDRDEQRRRYAAALAANPQLKKEVLRRISRVWPESVGTLFQRNPDSGEIEATPAMVLLEQMIVERKAKVLFVDPLAELHNADENDNTAMRAVLASFRALAQRLGIAICVLHHDRKGQGIAGEVDRMRGASSLAGAARVVLTLTRMTEEEATTFGIPPEERRSYIRIDNAKANYSPAGEAQWFHLDGYTIPNGEVIAAATPWTPPQPLDGITRTHMIQILQIAQQEPPEGRRRDIRSQGWLGNAIVEQTSLDEHKAKAAIAALVRSGALVMETIKDSKRMPRAVLSVDENIFLEIKQGLREPFGQTEPESDE